jgi:superfamily II DNA or RNA helicase
MSLRGHQQRAVAAAVGALAEGGRAQVVMACGTGKTLVALHAAVRLAGIEGGPVLVLVPSLALLTQTLRVWREQDACGSGVLAVCSDDALEREEGWGTTADIAVQCEVSTDPGRVASFLSAAARLGSGPDSGRRARCTVFATYHSAPRIADAYAAASDALPAFAVVVFDEAHRAAADPAAPFSTALHDVRIPAVRRLFLTATPRIQAPEPDHAPSLAAVHPGMSDEKLFGQRVFELPVAEAIERRLLSDYQVLVVGVDDADMHRLVLDENPMRIGPTTVPARIVAAQIALADAARTHGLRRVITFCGRVGTSRAFARALPHTAAALAVSRRPVGEVHSRHVDATTPAADREEALGLLRDVPDGHWAVVSNVRVLGEGVDCPSLDAVLFCDPRSSQTDVVQAVGRAIRLHPERPDQPAVIVLPVYLGAAESAEAVLEWSAFRHIWQVLAALRDHDARLGAQLRRARQQLALSDDTAGPHARTLLPDRIRIHLPADVDDRFTAAFTARLLHGVTHRHEEGLARLRRYTDLHGIARPHTHYTDPDGFKLGRWAAERRKAHARGLIDPELAADLQALPGWSWNVFNDTWTACLEELRAFSALHGHLDVPHHQLTPHGVKLAGWLHAQRTQHTRGQLSAQRLRCRPYQAGAGPPAQPIAPAAPCSWKPGNGRTERRPDLRRTSSHPAASGSVPGRRRCASSTPAVGWASTSAPTRRSPPRALRKPSLEPWNTCTPSSPSTGMPTRPAPTGLLTAIGSATP